MSVQDLGGTNNVNLATPSEYVRSQDVNIEYLYLTMNVVVNPGPVGCIYGLLRRRIAMEHSRMTLSSTNSPMESLTA